MSTTTSDGGQQPRPLRPDARALDGVARGERREVLPVVTVALVSAAVVAVLVVLALVGLTAPPGGVSGWQVAAGYGLALAGLALQLSGVVVLLRSNHRRWAGRRRPPQPSRAIRKRLLAQVRGRRPAEPADLPRAREVAEQLIRARPAAFSQLGLGVTFTGRWIAAQTQSRALLAGVVLLILLLTVLVERDARRARQFLGDHPGDHLAG